MLPVGAGPSQKSALNADPMAWQDYQNEIALLEGGSMDGLEDEPPYFSAEELEEIRANNPHPAIG